MGLIMGESIPINEVHPSFIRGGTLNKISSGFINCFGDFGRDFDITHHIGRNAFQGGFCKNKSASHT